MFSRNEFGFTLIEVLIGTSIFAVLCLGIFQVTQTFRRGASNAIKTGASQEDIAQLFITVRKELTLARDLEWPPLKINDQRLETRSIDGEKIKYLFDHGVLKKLSDDLEMKLIQGLKNINFYRHDSQLLEIKIQTENETLMTWVYLPNLSGIQ